MSGIKKTVVFLNREKSIKSPFCGKKSNRAAKFRFVLQQTFLSRWPLTSICFHLCHSWWRRWRGTTWSSGSSWQNEQRVKQRGWENTADWFGPSGCSGSVAGDAGVFWGMARWGGGGGVSAGLPVSPAAGAEGEGRGAAWREAWVASDSRWASGCLAHVWQHLVLTRSWMQEHTRGGAFHYGTHI